MARMLIWRRHTPDCPHSGKGRDFTKCTCPLWADGYTDGRRTLRVSLKTRDMARAVKHAAALDCSDDRIVKPVSDAVKAFLGHCKSEGLKDATISKYKNPLTKLMEFCGEQQIDSLDGIERGKARPLPRLPEPETDNGLQGVGDPARVLSASVLIATGQRKMRRGKSRCRAT